MVGRELPKLKRSGRGGAVMPLVELRSPFQSLIGGGSSHSMEENNVRI